MALFVGQDVIRAFSRIEQRAAGSVVLGIVAVLFQPVLHVGEAGYRRDLDALLETKLLRRYRAVDPIGQPGVALLFGLDDRGGVYPGPRAERVGPHDGIIDWNRHPDRVGHEPAVLRQLANVSLVRAQQLQIHDQQVHLGIPDPLTDAECGGMDAIHTGFDRGEAIDQAHAAIAMPMPVDFYGVSLDDFLLDEFYQRFYAIRRRVTYRVSETDAPGATVDRRTV